MYKIKKIFKLNKKFFSKNIKIKKNLLNNLKNNLKKKYKLKIYIKRGGCNGFKYNFLQILFTKKFNILLKIKSTNILIDTISKVYLINSIINYNFLNKIKFIIKNKNIKTKCNCGVSFNIK